MSSIEERVARGLTLATWIVGIIWIVGSVAQLVVWVLILLLGGEAVYPFFGWTLGIGATLVATLLLLSFAVRGIARTTAQTSRPEKADRGARVDNDAEDLL